jgi:hypothetical protein
MSARVTSKAVLICAWLTVLLIIGCERETAPTQSGSAKREQELPLTFGGFLKGGPEDERLDGVCGPDLSRNVVECDIYNGLPGWRITEITIKVVILPLCFAKMTSDFKNQRITRQICNIVT